MRAIATPDGKTRFLHLSDLHLMPCPHGGACGPNDAACHACIKRMLLERLRERISTPQCRPDLILIAGDLTERRDCASHLRSATEPLERLVRAARDQNIVVCGITGDHDGADATAALRKELKWDWLLHSGEVNRDSGVAVHGVEGRPNRAGAGTDFRALRPEPGEPSIVLVHDELRTLRTPESPRFDYFAMGHLHRGRIKPLARGSRGVAAYPGHLFSYWDGDGKSWPSYVIEGTISARGDVSAELLSLSQAFDAPETRRMYIAHADAGRPEGTVVFENAPPEDFFRRLNIDAEVADQLDGGAVYRRLARLKYASHIRRDEVLRRVLENLPDDVFVTPSTGGGWRDRLADYGRSIVARRFSEFVAKTHKRSANTQ